MLSALLSVLKKLNVFVFKRWVSEKLSVESLRDLDLFGGEYFTEHCAVAVLILWPL